MNIYAVNAIPDLRFYIEALTVQKQSARNAKEKMSEGCYLFLDSLQVTNSPVQDLKPVVPLVLQKSVTPVDEENKKQCNFIKYQEV